MKKLIFVILAMFMMTSCSGWFFQPSPYYPPTPFLPATNTPSIVTPTPVVIGMPSATPSVATAIPVNTNTPFSAVTNTPNVIPTDTLSVSPTPGVATPDVNVEVLGCNTSVDVTHGMGEVTNAYITLSNSGNVELTNLKATLFALDEGREHPDKTVEVTSIPVGYEVTLKLTVDSTYQEETPIQVEVTADAGLFDRVGASSCRDIGLFTPKPDGLNTPVPVNP